MAWIELHQAVWTHRKTFELAGILEIDETYAAAHVIRLWTWALDNAPDGVLSTCSARAIAYGAGWRSGDANAFVEALVRVGWLDENLTIHDWNKGNLPIRVAWVRWIGRSRERARSAMRRAWEAMARRVRPLIFARDGYRCLMCGADRSLEVDHIISLARGGSNTSSNLRTLCKPCNRRKGAS